jgi:hypothetical protein
VLAWPARYRLGRSRPLGTADQHALLRKWRRAYRRQAAAWKRLYGDSIPAPLFPLFPSQLAGMRCGARTRTGKPCRRAGLFPSGRCRLHGGRSTGPKTAEGMRIAAANGHRPKRLMNLISEANPMKTVPEIKRGMDFLTGRAVL